MIQHPPPPPPIAPPTVISYYQLLSNMLCAPLLSEYDAAPFFASSRPLEFTQQGTMPKASVLFVFLNLVNAVRREESWLLTKMLEDHSPKKWQKKRKKKYVHSARMDHLAFLHWRTIINVSVYMGMSWVFCVTSSTYQKGVPCHTQEWVLHLYEH